MILDELQKHSRFVIFGAQVIAYGAYKAMKELTGRIPDAFVVSSLEKNPEEIDGIKVITPEALPKDIYILVGVTELIQKEVVPALKKQGFMNLFCLTQHEEYLLMNRYFTARGDFLPAKKLKDFPCNYQYDTDEVSINKCFEEKRIIDMAKCSGKNFDLRNPDEKRICGDSDFAIYEVRNHRDNPLSREIPLHPYEFPIQAGAAVSDKRVASLLDNTGINISEKNRQYCEMTATYWVWKNTNHTWKGIEHYRRHMLVSPDLLQEDVDVLMPYPYLCYPNTMAQFQRFVSKDVHDALWRALKAVHPDEYEEYKKILLGELQYTYNLVCAKREVFDAYCSWFFEITEYMETLADEVPEIKETRALSYVAEVLTNLYFMYHKELRIRHVEREIYV